MLGTDENKRIVRRFYEHVVNAGAVDEIEQFLSRDYVEVHENTRYPSGIEGAKEHILGSRRVYENLHLTVGQQIAEGEWVVSRVTMRGVHAGEWMGIAPTGEAIEMTVVNIDRVVDGKIVEHGGAANVFESLLRVGAIRVVGQ